MSKAIRFALLSACLFAAGAEAGAAAVEPKLPTRLKPAEKALLTAISDGGDSGIRVPDQNAPEFVTLVKAQWVQTHPGTIEGTSIIARLSPTGKTKVESFRGARDPNAVSTRPTEDLSEVEIETFDLSKIEASRRQVRAVYPFEKLTAPGQSFFVAAPEAFPADKDFAATKQGTVGGFNRKSKADFEALPADQKAPGAVAATLKAINDTKNGVRGVRFVRLT